jgi:hypothetical protein
MRHRLPAEMGLMGRPDPNSKPARTVTLGVMRNRQCCAGAPGTPFSAIARENYRPHRGHPVELLGARAADSTEGAFNVGAEARQADSRSGAGESGAAAIELLAKRFLSQRPKGCGVGGAFAIRGSVSG